MIFGWTESLSIGIDQIDQQHQELFTRVNKLLSATARGQARKEVAKMFKALEEYVETHFSTEESSMSARRYPNLSSHKAEHWRFLQEFDDLKARFEKEGATDQLEAMIEHKICRWLLNHIGKQDRPLGIFLQD